MSKIMKSKWIADSNKVRLSLPFAKIDQENRLVHGFATLDNADSQDDVVEAEASQRAFARARGNLREMHQPIAAGRMVSFSEEEFFDAETGMVHRGIYASAYVSKGAEATWEKVLDGTLTGFSIGGDILEQESRFVPDMNKTIRFVKDYDLVELSLVDNPANPLANIFSITKAEDGKVMIKGLAMETKVENVHYCEGDEIFVASPNEAVVCVACGNQMDNVGWFESTDTDRTEKVRDVISKFMDSHAVHDNGEGGVDMGKDISKNTEVEETSEEATTVDETGTDETAATAVVEETATAVEETPDESEVFTRKVDELKEAFEASLVKTREHAEEQATALEKKITDLNDTFTTKFSEFDKKFTELSGGLETEKDRMSEFEKKLDLYNSSDSVKKSGDVVPEKVQKTKTVWNGTFSIDNLLK